MLVAVPNNISFNNNNNSADTVNAPCEIDLLLYSPANTVKIATQLRFDFVGNSVLFLRKWGNTNTTTECTSPLHFTLLL